MNKHLITPIQKNNFAFYAWFFTAITMSYPLSAYAFFCPNNFNQIEFGNTTDQVLRQCGPPDKQEETKKVDDNVPQEWSYYIPQTVSSNTSVQTQGTLKTQMTFDNNGKAINISVNGIGVGGTTICGNRIQLGDNRDQIKAACGNPSFINKQSPPGNAVKAAADAPTITTFTYNTNPPVRFIFENGVLAARQ